MRRYCLGDPCSLRGALQHVPDRALGQPPAAFGFDDISDAHNMSSVLLEKYADAAERSMRTAICSTYDERV